MYITKHNLQQENNTTLRVLQNFNQPGFGKLVIIDGHLKYSFNNFLIFCRQVPHRFLFDDFTRFLKHGEVNADNNELRQLLLISRSSSIKINNIILQIVLYKKKIVNKISNAKYPKCLPLKMLIVWSQGSLPSAVGLFLRKLKTWLKKHPSDKSFILSTGVALSKQQFTHLRRLSFFWPILFIKKIKSIVK